MICYSCKNDLPNDSYQFRKDRGKYRTICKNCKNSRQRKNYYKRKEIEPFKFKHNKLKSTCKQRGLKYDLDAEFLKGIWTGKCPISDEEIFISTNNRTRADARAAELDRFIPELGYIKGNVTWISREYNMKKQNSSLEDLKRIVIWMESHVPIKSAKANLNRRIIEPWNKGLSYSNDNIAGEKNGYAKLKKQDVIQIRKEFSGKRGQIKKLSERYNVSQACISKIVNNKTWKNIGADNE